MRPCKDTGWGVGRPSGVAWTLAPGLREQPGEGARCHLGPTAAGVRSAVLRSPRASGEWEPWRRVLHKPAVSLFHV